MEDTNKYIDNKTKEFGTAIDQKLTDTNKKFTQIEQGVNQYTDNKKKDLEHLIDNTDKYLDNQKEALGKSIDQKVQDTNQFLESKREQVKMGIEEANRRAQENAAEVDGLSANLLAKTGNLVPRV